MDFELTHSNGIYIPHLSPSTINSWITDKFGFYQSKVLRRPFQGNELTVRGQAVEHAVNVFMETGEDNPAVALEYFDQKIVETGVHKFDYQDTRDAIPGLTRLALDTYKKEMGSSPFLTQTKIEVKLEGVNRTILGYLDFFKPGQQVRDCKVSGRSPSKLSQNYILQGSAYKKATGDDVIFDFFIATKKPNYKSIRLSDDEFIFGISYMTKAAQAIEELETCDDPKRVMELMSFPNLDSIWNPKERQEAASKYGIILK